MNYTSVISRDIDILCNVIHSALFDKYGIPMLGRVEKMLRKNRSDEAARLIPIQESTAVDGADYDTVLPRDNSRGFGFIYVDSTIPVEDWPDERGWNYNPSVSIIFWGRMEDLPDIGNKTYRFRVFMEEVIEVLRSYPNLEITSVISNDTTVYDPFSIDKDTMRYFYYPYYAFRINGNLKVTQLEPC
jgi:hypothetical protein